MGRWKSILKRAFAAASLAFASPALGMPLHPCLAEDADCSLREIARAAGVRIGAATQPGLIAGDPRYAPTLASEFDSITAENQMKWDALQPTQGNFQFGPADELVAFARANDQRMRGHTLLWANPIRIPDWVETAPDAETLRGWLDTHIRTVVGRYKDDVDAWDVVNEPLENFSSDFFDNVFSDLLGRDYIADAFRIAHEADPEATLFLNEVLLENPNTPRFQNFYDLVVDLLADGVPIHGVGFQGHLIQNIVDPDPEAFRAAVQAFADLGLVVEITELDVAMPTGDVDLQGETVYEIMSACLSVTACEGITFWGFTDAHTWIDGTLGPGLVPLPFDDDYARKPAYEGARRALLERLARTVPEPSLLLLAAIVAAALRRTR